MIGILSAGRILSKRISGDKYSQGVSIPITYDNAYNYGVNNNPYALKQIIDNNTGEEHNFNWDLKGNMIYHRNNDNGERRLCWTEDNRLQAVKDNKMGAYYNYDASGERNLKLTGGTVDVTQNGYTINVPVLDQQTLYASAFLTINDKGYTKHYFEEGKRICSKIGSGGLHDVGTLVDHMEMNYEEQLGNQKDGLHITFNECFGISPELATNDIFGVIKPYTAQVNPDEPVFFYHSDHLGSASYITDDQGNATQHLVYLPFGEDWVDMKYNTSQFETPYKFNGKEKDPETGYNYYRARYLNTDLSIWLSVDPMSDKYPHLSSYNYCANNPVMLIDPDGREIFITGEASDKAVEQLQNKSKLKLSRDSETGKLSSKGFAWTKSDRALKEAIKDKKTKVNITAKNDNLISTDGNGHELRSRYGGSYMGNTLSEDGKSVSTSQFVAPDLLGAKDREVGDKITGGYMLHEVMESYYGGKIALEPGGKSSPREGLLGSTYDIAHGMANSISKGGWEDVYGTRIRLSGFGTEEKWGIRYNKENVKKGIRRCD